MAYFLAGDNVELDPLTLLLYNKTNMAKEFGVLPHQTETMPMRDYFVCMEISNAKKEKKELDDNMREAWNL